MTDQEIIGIGLAYLFGGICTGYYLVRFKAKLDIREHGSKNIGATNVWRILGAKLGAICFVLDVLKGAIPVLVVGFIR